MHISILCPLFNDWDSANELIENIEREFTKLPEYNYNIFLVNDCSTDSPPDWLFNKPKVKIIHLRSNLGHQRAIACGLCFLFENIVTDYALVMDADGEDRPEDIPKLIDLVISEKNKKIIFAQRDKRKESYIFKIGYNLYKLFFRLLTGKKINFGNFSIIPKQQLSKVVYNYHIWNSYNSAILNSKLAIEKIKLDRGYRYSGLSKMNYYGLILHGISAISIYLEIILVRLLILTGFSFAIVLLITLVGLVLKYQFNMASPGWVTQLILGSILIFFQLFIVSLVIALHVLGNRHIIHSPPINKYKEFIE